ncbi:MAG: hypothetical protein JRE40_00330 [Deltaproteobacteria bacterium]|nr:hypothetical protein [Deltaproteobacteria bacterium]
MKTKSQFGKAVLPYLEDKHSHRHFFQAKETDHLTEFESHGELAQDLLEQDLLDPLFSMVLTKDEVVGLRHVLGPMTENEKTNCGCTENQSEAIFQFFKRIAQFCREMEE